MSINILAIIVVFGRNSIETPAFKTLLKTHHIGQSLRVVIWDNSPLPTVAPLNIAHNDCHVDYVSTPENLGLSNIYNRVIKDWLREDEFLLILDQDTFLPIDFCSKLSNCISQYPNVDLYLPMVRANQRWVSPLYYFLGWGRSWSNPHFGIINAKHHAAINSGMVISGRYLKGDFAGYDERIKFYGTDTQFMVTYAAQRDVLCVIDATLEHDLSFFSSDGIVRLRKFQEMRHAYQYIYENHLIMVRLAVRAVMFCVSCIYALRFRDLGYLSKHIHD